MYPTVYLVRHGAIGDNAQHRYIGQSDLPLTPIGVRQAQAVATWLSDKAIDAVYCSDLSRTVETARIIASATKHQEIWIRRDLREISLGEWEGRPRDEVATQHPEDYAARGADMIHFRVPGGESFADCLTRALRVWQEILAGKQRHVVIAAHAGVNRLLLSHVLGTPLAQFMQIPQPYGCLNVLCHNTKKWEVNTITLPVDVP